MASVRVAPTPAQSVGASPPSSDNLMPPLTSEHSAPIKKNKGNWVRLQKRKKKAKRKTVQVIFNDYNGGPIMNIYLMTRI